MTFKWFEKHQKGLLVVLTVFTVLTFSITGAIYGIFEGAGAEEEGVSDTAGTYRRISTGETVEVSAQEFFKTRQLLHRVRSYIFRQSDLDNAEVWRHIVLLDEAKRSGVYFSDSELKDFLARVFPGVSKEDYVQHVRRNTQLTPAQFESALREMFIVNRFVTLNQSSFVSEKRVYDHFRGTVDKYGLEYVVFPWDGAAADIDPANVTDEQLTEFYDELDPNTKAEFRQEDQVAFRMAYLAYAKADPAAIQTKLPEGTAEPSEDELRAFYDRNKFQFRKPEPAEEEGEPGDGEQQSGDEDASSAEENQGEGEKSGEGKKDQDEGEQSGEKKAGDGQSGDGEKKEGDDGEQRGGFYFSRSSIQEESPQENEPVEQEGPADEGEQPPAGEEEQGEGEQQPTGEEEQGEGEEQPAGDEATDEAEAEPEDPYKPFEEVRDEVLQRFQVDRLLSRFIERARTIEDKTFVELADELGLETLVSDIPQTRSELEEAFVEKGIAGNGSVISHLFFTPVESVYGRVVGNGTIGSAIEPTERFEDRFKPLEEVRERILELYIEKQKEEAAREKAEALITAMKEKVKGEFEEQIEEIRQGTEEVIEDRIVAEATPGEDATEEEKEAAEKRRQEIREEEEKILEENIDDLLAERASTTFGEVAQELGLEVKKTDPFRSSFAGTPAYSLLEEGPDKYLKGPMFVQILRSGLVPNEVRDSLEPVEGEPGLATLEPVRDEPNGNFYVVRLAEFSDPTPAEMTPEDYEIAGQTVRNFQQDIQTQRKWAIDLLKGPNRFDIQPTPGFEIEEPERPRSTSPR